MEHVVENVLTLLCRLIFIFPGLMSMTRQHLMARIRIECFLNVIVVDSMTLMLGTIRLSLLKEGKVALRLVIVA